MKSINCIICYLLLWGGGRNKLLYNKANTIIKEKQHRQQEVITEGNKREGEKMREKVQILKTCRRKTYLPSNKKIKALKREHEKNPRCSEATSHENQQKGR